MRRAWQGAWLVGAGLVIGMVGGCANAQTARRHAVECRADDPPCRNVAWQQTPQARQHQQAMQDARRKEQEARMRQVLAEAKQESRARGRAMAELEAAQWWCFEGRDNELRFGECRPTPQECSTRRKQRVAAGLVGASECEPYAHSICFNATPSLKKTLDLYCFPQRELCARYRQQALARNLFGVSACGLL